MEMTSRFLGFGSGLNSIYSRRTGQQGVCSCLCPTKVARRHTDVQSTEESPSSFHPAAERISDFLQCTIHTGWAWLSGLQENAASGFVVLDLHWCKWFGRVSN